MAFILTKSFVLNSLSQVGVTEAQFDAATLSDKAALLSAVAKASYAADMQSILASNTALIIQSLVTSQKQAQVADAQLVWYAKANAAASPP